MAIAKRILIFLLFLLFLAETEALVFRPDVTQQERDQLLNSFPRFYEWGMVLIDPTWFITAAHCGMTSKFTYNGIEYNILRHYIYGAADTTSQLPKIDIMVGELDKPFLDPHEHHLSIQRYRGPAEEDSIIWVFGRGPTNKPGISRGPLVPVVSPNGWQVGTNRILPYMDSDYIRDEGKYLCNFDGHYSPNSTKYEALMVGGDSGGANVIHISCPKDKEVLPKNNKDFFADFRLCGLNSKFEVRESLPVILPRTIPLEGSVISNNSQPSYHGDFGSVRLNDPRIQNWLDNLIIARALDMNFPAPIPRSQVPAYPELLDKPSETHEKRNCMAIMIAPEWLIASDDGVDHKALWIRMSENGAVPDKRVEIKKNLNEVYRYYDPSTRNYQTYKTSLRLIRLEEPVFPSAVDTATNQREIFCGYKRLMAGSGSDQNRTIGISLKSLGTGSYLPTRDLSKAMIGEGILSTSSGNALHEKYLEKIVSDDVQSLQAENNFLRTKTNLWINNILIRDALGDPNALDNSMITIN